MTTQLQVIVPLIHDHIHLLEGCLYSISDNTPVEHVVNVAVGKAVLEDKVGEIVAMARNVYERTGLVISVCPPSLGYNGVVMDVLNTSDFPYTLVLPATHRIDDKEWFGKMQLPHIRAPGCGMTFAFDDIEGNTRPPHPWDRRVQIKSKVFMVQRAVIGSVRETPIDDDGDDIADAVRNHLLTVATACWAVPACRIAQMSAETWK
jgi:hypothetical protein